MLYNALGPFQMLFIKGEVVLPQQRSELIERPGVAGVGLMRTGRRGEPFALRSKVDAPSLWDGQELLRQYELIVGGDPVYLVKDDIPYSDLFFVLAMRPLVCHALGGGIGGLNEDALAWVEADWELIAIGG
jgi:hypothetical protein